MKIATITALGRRSAHAAFTRDMSRSLKHRESPYPVITVGLGPRTDSSQRPNSLVPLPHLSHTLSARTFNQPTFSVVTVRTECPHSQPRRERTFASKPVDHTSESKGLEVHSVQSDHKNSPPTPKDASELSMASVVSRLWTTAPGVLASVAVAKGGFLVSNCLEQARLMRD